MEQTITADKVSELVWRLKNSVSTCIVSHFHPDGDALGSTMAMLHFIRETLAGKADAVLSSPAPDNLKFLLSDDVTDVQTSPEETMRRIREADLLICLDLNNFSRPESLQEELRVSRSFKILVDHHLNPSVQDFDMVFSDCAVSSTCELLFRILMATPDIGKDAARLPRPAATALMTGMTTDTNNFANSVFPGTLEMASSLLAAGVDREDILDRIYRKHRENRLRALGYLLSEGMKITPHGVAYMIIDSRTAGRFDIHDGETEGFVNEPLAMEKVKMSILLKEDGGRYRVSVRSKRGTSANRLAAMFFHGGGHEQAAGGRLLWPQDIPDSSKASDYIEEVTARFMQNDMPPKIEE